ncbi:hypothetical protein C1S82_16040 [Mycolicibacterium cosmeticum]|jgi:hypothetical protein|uniref:Uncharacterized protein n=1 Tax=Mycolicibacterium cosmeticum TaxID=258533 RepID=W9BKX3_MYCCO|nr:MULTISPECIES: hypothetical protein [Mycolicibacterium]MDX1872781.1 hypothetical protein [Mycolicibacterium sp. 120266]TLH73465.1 hypothetical protein C1S82_16040 [Mycolicibacterium cosmeticum]CDO08650.1 hypothetical protein BN977_03469 [Mycolicibacterium cosmeticum]
MSKSVLATVVAAGAILGSALGMGTAAAEPPVDAGGPALEAPANAPKKPAESWQGHPMVWWDWGSGGHWGVWVNGQFLPFS